MNCPERHLRKSQMKPRLGKSVKNRPIAAASIAALKPKPPKDHRRDTRQVGSFSEDLTNAISPSASIPRRQDNASEAVANIPDSPS
jgi:hypothetical protein